MEDEVALTDLGSNLGQIAMCLGKLTEFKPWPPCGKVP